MKAKKAFLIQAEARLRGYAQWLPDDWPSSIASARSIACGHHRVAVRQWQLLPRRRDT
jgi:hypothetical protein